MNENKNIKIVMFNMSSYGEWEHGISNRNRHILNELVKSEQVAAIFAIDYLPLTFKRLLRNFWQNIVLPNKHKTIFWTPLTKIYRVNPKLIVCSSILPFFSKKLFYQTLKWFLKRQGFTDYAVWSYFPLEVGYFTELEPTLKVFDMVDNWAEHPSYKKFKHKILANYNLIDDAADIIFTVAEDLRSIYKNQAKVHWLPNGVDLKHFQEEFAIINRDIADLPKPIIGYLGTIQDRVDLDLVEYLAQQNLDKSIVMVGPVWYKNLFKKILKQNDILKRFAGYKNVYFLGRKSYAEAPMYLQQFSVGIIPHTADAFQQSTNPMKVYDYLATGKPVVATKGALTGEQFKNLLLVAETYEEFNKLINQALAEDSEALKAERVNEAKEHSWLKRVQTMLEIITAKL